MKKYKYLKNEEGRNEKDVFECNETVTRRSLIVQNNSKQYIHFESIEDYESKYHNKNKTGGYSKHNFQEVILQWQPQKPKFDINDGNEEDHIFIIEMIEDAFYETYGIIPNLVIMNSVNTHSDQNKLSKHIIVTNYAFANSFEAKNFTCNILKPSILYERKHYLDDQVNGSTQHFRLPLTTNDKGRRLDIPTGFSFADLVVSNTIGVEILPYVATYIQKEIISLDEDVSKYIEGIDPKVFRYTKMNGNLLIFKRMRRSYCDICECDHDNVGLYICIHRNKITRHCYRSKKFITTERENVLIEKQFNDFDQVYKWFKRNDANIEDIKDILMRFIFIRNSGSTSTVLLKLDQITGEYELQHFGQFMACMVRYKIGKISFATIIEKYLDEFFYKEIVFNTKCTPERTINLFHGFKAKLVESIDHERLIPILSHIRETWCYNDEIIYNYVLDWIASVLQGNKNRSAIVLYSDCQNVSGSIITDFLRDCVIGKQYSIEINDIESTMIKFSNKVLTMFNNIPFIDHNPFDKINNLIRNKNVSIKTKGVNNVIVNDYNNYIINTNNSRLFKLEPSKRQYSILQLNTKYCDNKEYFDGLIESLKSAADDFFTLMMHRVITTDLFIPISSPCQMIESDMQPMTNVNPDDYIGSFCIYLIHITGDDYKFGLSKQVNVRWKQHIAHFSKHDQNQLKLLKIWKCNTKKIMQVVERNIKIASDNSKIRVKKYQLTEIISTQDINPIIDSIDADVLTQNQENLPLIITNHIDQFIANSTYTDQKQFVSTLYTNYKDYCANNDIIPTNASTLIKQLIAKQFITPIAVCRNVRKGAKVITIIERTICPEFIRKLDPAL